MNKIYLLVIFVNFFSCSTSKHCKISNKIFIAHNKELQKQKDIFLVGFGGAMMGDIQKVCAHYESHERLAVNEARSLYVEIIEGYLKKYNGDEVIRPFLHDYPFTIENLEVNIGFYDSIRQRIDNGFVAYMFIGKNHMLIYKAYDPKTDEFIHLYDEPYEVARQIVYGQ
jgi:hypothetical protein